MGWGIFRITLDRVDVNNLVSQEIIRILKEVWYLKLVLH